MKVLLGGRWMMSAWLVFVAVGPWGCAGKQVRQSPVASAAQQELEDAPDWVLGRGCGERYSERQDVICGVGSAGGMRNLSLARTTAIARGRTELARTLQSKVEAMLKDYQASTTGGEAYGKASWDEQEVTDVSRQLTSMTLNGAHLADTWVSPNGTFYALVVLDAAAFSRALDGMQTLSEKAREAIHKRAEDAFREMNEELRRRAMH